MCLNFCNISAPSVTKYRESERAPYVSFPIKCADLSKLLLMSKMFPHQYNSSQQNTSNLENVLCNGGNKNGGEWPLWRCPCTALLQIKLETSHSFTAAVADLILFDAGQRPPVRIFTTRKAQLFLHKWKDLEPQTGLKQMQSNPAAGVRSLSVPVSQRQLLHQQLRNRNMLLPTSL